MATGTIRYWAGARAAAGVAEEQYDAATLADALVAAREAHGPGLEKVLSVCSFLVDDAPVGTRPHETVQLTDGGSVEVLPPFAGGSADAADAGAEVPRRQPPGGRRGRLAGAIAGIVAAAVAGCALAGIAPLAGGVFAVQVVLALAWLAAFDVPGSGGVFVLLVIASGVMDGVVGTGSEPDIGRAAGVVGVGVVVGLLYQLARRPRVDVTASFAGTLAGLLFALCATSYVGLRLETDGDLANAAALFGIGAALVAARLVDVVLPRPAAVPGSRRGIVGMLVGVGAAFAAGWAYGGTTDGLGHDVGVRIAVVAAIVAIAADLAIDAVLCAAPPRDARARSALAPLGLLLPVVLAGPAAYVSGRILLG